MLARFNNLLQEKIILASSSAGRKKILDDAGIPCVQVSSNFDESQVDPMAFGNVDDYVKELALQKALSVSKHYSQDNKHQDLTFIGLDTVVVLGKEIFGKPASDIEASNTLHKLSGRKHSVYTGMVLINKKEIRKFAKKTDVYFAHLTDDQIRAYIDTKEPFGRAGSYAIQGLGGTFVERIDGDYFNICGLPLHRLSEEIYDLYKNKI